MAALAAVDVTAEVVGDKPVVALADDCNRCGRKLVELDPDLAADAVVAIVAAVVEVAVAAVSDHD